MISPGRGLPFAAVRSWQSILVQTLYVAAVYKGNSVIDWAEPLCCCLWLYREATLLMHE
jgi:hypothetical protein